MTRLQLLDDDMWARIEPLLPDRTERARPRPLGPPLIGHAGVVTSTAFAPSGHTPAAVVDGKVFLWI